MNLQVLGLFAGLKRATGVALSLIHISESPSFSDGFRSSGDFTKRLPAGPTRIRITRGFETKAINQEVNLVAGETNCLTFTLERAVNLRERGWFAGDSHVHMLHGERTVQVDFDYVALTAQAEDLQYMSLSLIHI